MIDVRMFTVGPLRENCFMIRRPHAATAVLVDPGAEAERLLHVQRELGITRLEAILVTHTHFDHVGAVAAVARATGAPVYCPELERDMLVHLGDGALPGFGPFEGYEAEETVVGGETLELAGLRFDVRFTPGHSVGHVSYSIRDEDALLSGDVLFEGSVGRVDLPGGDWPTLRSSIEALFAEFGPETVVHPGHMGLTTLGRERVANPFLRELSTP